MDLRKLFRLLAIVGAVVFSVYEGFDARRNYQGWQFSVRIGDRSGMDGYRLGLEIDCAQILVAWAFAGGLIYVLRPKLPRKP